MTLTEFLNARLNDDWEAALSVRRLEWEPDSRITTNPEGGGVWVLGDDGAPVAIAQFATADDGDGIDPRGIADHIARHDPARVLREIAAKRAVLDLHTWSSGIDGCWSCSGDHGADPTPAPCETLRHLAAVYADHPDYRQGWTP